MRTRQVLSFAVAAACVFGGPRLVRAQGSDEVIVRVPGHWETRTETGTVAGHWAQRSKAVWIPARVEIEAQTTRVAGYWSSDVAGNQHWVPERTVVQNVAINKPGEWKTVLENVWVAESTATVERQYWVPEQLVRRACTQPVRGPWDETPRSRNEPVLPRVTVSEIKGTAPLSPWSQPAQDEPILPHVTYAQDFAPPSSARLRERELPTQPRSEHVDPWQTVEPRTESCPPPVRNVRPLVLVRNNERTEAPTQVVVVEAPSPQPRVVFVQRRAPAPSVYYASPRTYYPNPWDERPTRVGVGVRVGFGAGVSVRVGHHTRVGFGIGW